MKRNIYNLHKKSIAAIVLLLVMSLPMNAQVFMMDGDENYREPEDPAVFINLPSDYGLGTDWYAPVGNGVLLLTALGGAYLIGKRKNGNQTNNK